VTEQGIWKLWITIPKGEIMDELLAPIHPGEVLLEDFTKPLGLSQYRLAKDIGVAPIRIHQIIHGQLSIMVDTAMRFARYFGTSTVIWLRLQVRYDLERGENFLNDRIDREVKVLQRTV
jgi:antitoxin HigA-1